MELKNEKDDCSSPCSLREKFQIVSPTRSPSRIDGLCRCKCRSYTAKHERKSALVFGDGVSILAGGSSLDSKRLVPRRGDGAVDSSNPGFFAAHQFCEFQRRKSTLQVLCTQYSARRRGNLCRVSYSNIFVRSWSAIIGCRPSMHPLPHVAIFPSRDERQPE